MNPPPDDGRPAALDDLVFRYLEDLESTDSDPDDLLDEFCAEQPQYDTELRRAIAQLRASGLMPTNESAFPEEIGEFRLVRRLGSGGMGVVYLAEQPSLGRKVALKLVRPEQLYFGRARGRFRREVESAARLAHPGISQVYMSGEEGGVPYFAQEYIPGAALDAVLRAIPNKTAEGLRGSDLADALATCVDSSDAEKIGGEIFEGSWEQVCLRIARSVASALEHAHERGVLHRDVKPSNLILSTEGRVVLVDFGLANLSDANALTRTGAQLGSLPYMSPEQVEGRAEDIGPASDVYGLGVTLYELMTLRAPFGGQSSDQLRNQILEANALPPRAYNPNLGVDAQTVCQCAMDPEFGRRYSSAAALLADLDAVLAGETPKARPLGSGARMTRWALRHPAAAIAILLGMILVIGGPTAWGIMQTTHASNMKLAAQREARASLAAEQHFEMVLETLDSMMRRVGDSNLAELPGMTADRLSAIEGVLETYAVLQSMRPDDVLLAEYHTWAHHLRGTTLFDMSRFDESIQAFDDGLARIEPTLEVEDERRANRIWEKGALLIQRARTRARINDSLQASSDGARGIELLEQSLALDSSSRGRQGDLVIAFLNLGSAHRHGDNLEACAEMLKRARAVVESWEPGLALEEQQRRAHVQLLTEEARLATLRQDLRSALENYEEAVRAIDEELRLVPNEAHWCSTLVTTLLPLVDTHDARGELEAQLPLLDRAIREARKLVERYPHRVLYRSDLLSALGRQAHVSRKLGDFPASRDRLLQIAREWSARLALEPSNSHVRAMTASAWVNAANVVMMSDDLGPDRYEDSLRLLDRSSEALQHLETSLPLATGKVHLLYNRAVCFAKLDRIDETYECITTLESREELTVRDLRFLADMWNEWFLAVERRDLPGDPELADSGRARTLDYLEQAVAAGYADSLELSTTPALDSLRDEPRFHALLASLQDE